MTDLCLEWGALTLLGLLCKASLGSPAPPPPTPSPGAGPVCGEQLESHPCHLGLAPGGGRGAAVLRAGGQSGAPPSALHTRGPDVGPWPLGAVLTAEAPGQTLRRPQWRRARRRPGGLCKAEGGGSKTCTVHSPTWHYSWASFLPSAPEDGMKRREETGCSKKLRWLSSGDQLSYSPRPLWS